MKSREMIIVVGLTLITGLYSCEKESGENETKISSYNSSESHNVSKNAWIAINPADQGKDGSPLQERSTRKIIQQSTQMQRLNCIRVQTKREVLRQH